MYLPTILDMVPKVIYTSYSIKSNINRILECHWGDKYKNPPLFNAADNNITHRKISWISTQLIDLLNRLGHKQMPWYDIAETVIHDDVMKWKHFPRYWPFVRGIHRSWWIPRTKASDAELDDCGAGDLRRHRGHYDVNVMLRRIISELNLDVQPKLKR